MKAKACVMNRLTHVIQQRTLHRAVLVGCAAVLMLAAPGAIAADGSRASAATAQSDAADAEAAMPSFDLVDLRNGRSVDLARLRTPGRAMLVWLWAPG